MNIAEFAIKKKVITWALTLVMLVVGMSAFGNLPRLEDPEFTIKNAVIMTPYPGASAAEVEEEVTDLMERAAQELGQLWWVESTSSRGMSQVKVRIKDEFDKHTLPQVWDELRRKVTDYQGQLPPGAGPSVVNDDFGDVFGVYVVLTGQGYSMAELNETAKFLRRELLQVQDVKKIDLWGVHDEVVFVEMSRARMAALEVAPNDIFQALSAKNLPSDAGRLVIGQDYIPINPTGEFTSEQQFGELLIQARGGQSQVFLRDVATIRRGYQDPPRNIMRVNGERGIALGISTVQGGNVVVMGDALGERMEQLRPQIPLGMDLNVVSLQFDAVTEAVNGFMVNLVSAVIIVIVVLLFFMGLRSGLIIGGILFLTIAGTFLVMGYYQVTLERISLGALIIALGMLVDNAIVVVDGMKVRMEAGVDGLAAAKEVVGHNALPLLGATVVAITAFAAIGTSQDSTGEYCRTLYTVILISLSLSWLTAVTTTPLVCTFALKQGSADDEAEKKDPYAGKLFQLYKSGLMQAIRFRWVTVGAVAALFVVSLWAFGSVDQMFFPSSTRPQFHIDVYFPEGSHIEEVEAELATAEQHLLAMDEITQVSTAIGGGDFRFLLTYEPKPSCACVGVMFADVEDWRVIDEIAPVVQRELTDLLPDAVVATKKFRLGPGEGGRFQIRISGPDRSVLREMGSRVVDILREENAQGVYTEWRERVKVVRPQLAEAQARQLGITRPQLATALQQAFDGHQTSVYREADELLPIIARAPEFERADLDNINDLQIWSPAAQRMVPMRQVLSGFTTEWEDANIWRFNRTTTIRVHADPQLTELPSAMIARAKGRIERELGVDVDAYFGRTPNPDVDPLENHTSSTIAIQNLDRIPLKGMPGYYMAYGGEEEDSARAQGALAGSIPVFFGLMVLIVVLLFNAVREPLIIWLTVPLALIGVAWGLLLTRQPFGFMPLLGVMSLAGMLIKNSIVLIEEIKLQRGSGKDDFWAVVDSGVSRMRPVSMAAATTILGMIPLLTDAFFVAMAVTIMAGLLVATILTLIIVPVLYVIFFKIPYRGDQPEPVRGTATAPVTPSPGTAPPASSTPPTGPAGPEPAPA